MEEFKNNVAFVWSELIGQTYPIDFSPESIESQQQRFQSAINTVVTEESSPHSHREHVFDSEDGIRLVLYKQVINREPASICGLGWYFLPVFDPKKEKDGLRLRFEQRFREISGMNNAKLIWTLRYPDPVVIHKFFVL